MKRRPSIKDFGKRLSEARRLRGLSQRGLAKLIRSSGRMIAYYEGESTYPPTHLLVPICRALKVPADQLLGIESFEKMISQKDWDLWKKFLKLRRLSQKEQKKVFELIRGFGSR